tara:strand:+ start:1540 stop:1794 length:255 start_codon:yes stop_codon:yes gene_type:complete
MSIPKRVIFQIGYIGDTDRPVIVGDWMRPEKAANGGVQIPFDYAEYRLVGPNEKSKIDRIRAKIEKDGLMHALEIIDRISIEAE